MLKSMLLNLGALQVVTVSSGEAGLASHRQHRFDILLVDYNLGRGKNGRQVLEELRVKDLLRPDGVFMLISGESNRPMVLSAIELQPDDYLMKPFSNKLLLTRLNRAFKKRVALRKVYQALYRQQYLDCIQACLEHISEAGKYKNFCRQLASELYLKVGQAQEAEAMIQTLLEEQRATPALLILAKIKYTKNEPEATLDILKEIAKSSPNTTEAYDLMARTYEQQAQLEEALEAARSAISLAPFSISRQMYFADLARRNEAFELAKQAMEHVVDISRKSVHRNPKFLCTYIRSILDAAENSDSPQKTGKYQQEASLVLHRAKTEEALVYSNFDYAVLESAVMARINAFNGQLREAQTNMRDVIAGFFEQGKELPPEVAPDIIIALLDIGEFERAEMLAAQLTEDAVFDNYNKRLLQSRIEKSKTFRHEFVALNKAGIKLYTSGDYLEAIEAFEQALKIAPMNSGAALNYIQAAIQLFNQNGQLNSRVSKGCLGAQKIIEGLTLPESHQKRYTQLKEELEQLLKISA